MECITVIRPQMTTVNKIIEGNQNEFETNYKDEIVNYFISMLFTF